MRATNTTAASCCPKGAAKHCKAALYEVPPHKAAFPYYYHLANEESFCILQGHGMLNPSNGQRPVQQGDFLFSTHSLRVRIN